MIPFHPDSWNTGSNKLPQSFSRNLEQSGLSWAPIPFSSKTSILYSETKHFNLSTRRTIHLPSTQSDNLSPTTQLSRKVNHMWMLW